MSEFHFSYPACLVAGKTYLSRQDIGILRDIAFPGGIRCESDIVALLAINNSCPEKCAEWTDYFTETIASFIVDDMLPRGELNDAKAGLILRLFSSDGLIRTEEELALVLTLLERTVPVPESLVAFALDQVRLALQGNGGAYAATRRPALGGIAAVDLAFIERVLAATARQGGAERLSPLAISVLEALDRVARPVFNHEGWHDLLTLIRQQESVLHPTFVRLGAAPGIAA